MANISFIDVEVDASKVIADTEDELVVPVVLTREGVVQYPNGKAFRPAAELLKGAHTFEYLRITESKHPQARIPSGTALDQLITDPGQDIGHIQNVQFIADAVDPKGRKSAKIIGEAHIYKKNLYRGLPVNAASSAFLKGVAAGSIKQVSVGIIRDEEITPGEWQGEKYDFVHKNIVGNHLAVGVPNARTKPPFIGVGVDEMQKMSIDEFTNLQDQVSLCSVDALVSVDVWEETEEYIRSGHGSTEDIDPKVGCRTTDFDGKLPKGIKAIYCKKKGSDEWYVQSYLFPKDKFTLAEAKAWFKSQTSNDADSPAPTKSTAELVQKIRKYVR